MLSNNELKDMIELLESDCIDDPEDILDWFACNGVEILEELLEYRRKNKNGKFNMSRIESI